MGERLGGVQIDVAQGLEFDQPPKKQSPHKELLGGYLDALILRAKSDFHSFHVLFLLRVPLLLWVTFATA